MNKENTDATRALRQARCIEEVLDERKRQDEQWGEQNHHPAYWLAILGKQVGQFGSAVLDREWWVDNEAATQVLRQEAVQSAAVALAIVECIDRGKMPAGLTTAQPSDPRQLAKSLGRGDETIDYDGVTGICSCSSPPTTHTVFLHDAEVARDA